MSVIISSFAHVIIDLKLFAGFLLYQESHMIWHSYKNRNIYIYIYIYSIWTIAYQFYQKYTTHRNQYIDCILNIPFEWHLLDGMCVSFFYILEPLNLYDNSIKAACPKMEYKINIFTPRFFIKIFFLFI